MPRKSVASTARRVGAKIEDARKLFNRRRTGLDHKAQTLILMAFKTFNDEVKVTIIYEYEGEVSFFRSDPSDEGRWWSSLDELVSTLMLALTELAFLTIT
jgi:hypothetical protein